MKRVLLVSILTALCVTACGQKSNLGLKARQAAKARNNNTGKDTKVEGAFTSIKNADTRKLQNNAKATRNVLLGDDSLQTNILCTNDFEQSINESARIKILGGGQVMLRQDNELEIPETAKDLDVKKVAAAKEVVNVLCMSPSTSTEKLEKFDNVKLQTLTVGEPTQVLGKFSTNTEDVQKVIVACGTEENLAAADQILVPESGVFPVQMILSMNTKLLIETTSDSKTQKEYLLLTCTQKAPDSKKADLGNNQKSDDSQEGHQEDIQKSPEHDETSSDKNTDSQATDAALTTNEETAE